MLKLSMTALLFVTTGAVNQIGLPKASLANVTTLVKLLLNRTTARVAISDTI
jgi:hypothetical protein